MRIQWARTKGLLAARWSINTNEGREQETVENQARGQGQTGWREQERGVAKQSEQSTVERAAVGAMRQPPGIGKMVAMEWGTMGQPWGTWPREVKKTT